VLEGPRHGLLALGQEQQQQQHQVQREPDRVVLFVCWLEQIARQQLHLRVCSPTSQDPADRSCGLGGMISSAVEPVMLASSLSWQQQICTHITNVHDAVLSMPAGLRLTPFLSTPAPAAARAVLPWSVTLPAM